MKPPAADQPLVYELSHRLRNGFNGRAAGTVQIVEIDHICLQALHGCFQVCAYFIVHVPAPASEKQLCGNHNLVAYIPQRFSNDALIVTDPGEPRTVDLRRVEQRTAVFLRVANCLDAVLFGWNLSVTVGKRHAAHADLGDFDFA